MAAVLVLCLGVFAAAVEAAPASRGLDDYAVTIWNENDGLFASRVMVIEQDWDGYLWVGTDIGLLRFDGVRFEPIGTLVDGALPPGEVTALRSARDGSLWIGVAAGSGLARLRDGTLRRYDGRSEPRGLILSILEDGAGTVWIGTSLGLWQFRAEQFTRVALPGDVSSGVVAIYEDRAGRLWLATPDAVLRRDASDAAIRVLERVRVSSESWQSFSEALDGTVWMADFERGFRPAEGIAAGPTARRGWGAALLHDRRGNFWVATRGQGLWRGRGSYRDEHVEVIATSHGLASAAVQCLFEDREGNIWVGTYAGLHRLTPHTVTPINDLPLARAMAAGADGSVWVGSNDGLTRISRTGRERFGAAEGMPGEVVLAMHPEANDAFWVTTERGVARFAHGRFSPSIIEPGAALGRIFSIAWHDGSAWLRDANFRLARVSARGEPLSMEGVPKSHLRSATTLATDSAGRLWIGSVFGGLTRRMPGGVVDTFESGVGVVNAIYEDASGALWIAGEGGLAQVQNGRIAAVTVRQGLRSVKSVVDDSSGTLWLGLGTGIARVERAEFARATTSPDSQLQYRLFNTADGAAGVPITRGSRTAVRARDGRLWFATSGGVTVVDPLATGERRPLVPARIEEVTADARRLRGSDALGLPPRTSHVQFAFTALTLTDSARVEFRYRLNGFETEWVHAGTVRQASYTNLPPGEYSFQVAASHGDGIWSEPDTLALSVAPAFYQTGWFYAAGLFALCASIVAGWQLHVRRVRRQFALVLAERIRMSRAIHDTLLQGLAGLALQLDDVSHGLDAASPLRDRIRSMRERIENSIREARQSIWELRNPQPANQPLADSLRDVAMRTIAQRPVTVDVAVHGAERRQPSEVEAQLVLICQEAVSNAVSHGSASRVRIELTYGPGEVRLRVEDNGCGFDELALAGTAAQHGHYGMMSMRERAAAAGGHAFVVSSPGDGTIVHVAVPCT